MRVSCLFVSVAIMLAGEIQAAPLVGLPTLPVLNNEGRLIDSVSHTLRPLPAVGGITGDLLEDSTDNDLLSATGLAGSEGLIKPEGTLGEIVGSLQRRQGLPLINTLGGITNGVENLSILGSVGSILPVTQGLTSNIGSLNGALPNIKHVATGATKVLPGTSLPVNLAILKRDNSASGFSSLPLIGSVPLLSSFPGMSSLPALPSLNSFPTLPSMKSLPGFSSLPLVSSVPGVSQLSSSLPSPASLNSLPLVSSVPGVSQLSSSIPSPASLEALL